MDTPNTDATKDWYYVQGLGFADGRAGLNSSHTVVFAKTSDVAMEKVKDWREKHNIRDVHLYRNNYKRDARKLVAQGNYII